MRNEHLRAARTARGLTQEEAARLLHTHRDHYGQWERGRYQPSGRYRAALCALFGCDVMALGLDPNATHGGCRAGAGRKRGGR